MHHFVTLKLIFVHQSVEQQYVSAHSKAQLQSSAATWALLCVCTPRQHVRVCACNLNFKYICAAYRRSVAGALLIMIRTQQGRYVATYEHSTAHMCVSGIASIRTSTPSNMFVQMVEVTFWSKRALVYTTGPTHCPTTARGQHAEKLTHLQHSVYSVELCIMVGDTHVLHCTWLCSTLAILVNPQKECVS